MGKPAFLVTEPWRIPQAEYEPIPSEGDGARSEALCQVVTKCLTLSVDTSKRLRIYDFICNPKILAEITKVDGVFAAEAERRSKIKLSINDDPAQAASAAASGREVR